MRGSASRTSGLLVVAALAVAGARPVSGQPRGDDDSAELVAVGRRALAAGDLARAGKALDQALALNPKRLEAYALRAAVHAARGEHDRGVALMRRARALAPDSDDVLTALATQLVLAGEDAEGVPLLEQVVGRDPGRYEALALLGHHHADHGRWAEAVTSLEAYRRVRPAALASEDDRHAIDLAEGYLRTRRAGEARALYGELTARQPTWRSARMGLAWATAAIDCRQARPLLAALAAEPEPPADVWLVDGRCALAMGQPREAVRLGRRYLYEAEPATAAGHALVGEAEAARGNLPAAKVALATARRLEPARRTYAVRLARVLRTGGDPTGALAELDGVGAPPVVGEDAAYWVERGEALLALGRAADAVRELAPAAEALPADAALATVVGEATLATGDADGAAVHLERALAAGGSRRAARGLSAALVVVGERAIAAGELSAARTALERAEQVHGTPAAWRAHGLALLAAGDPAAAEAVLARAVAGEREPVAGILLGRARAARGDVSGARAAFEQAAGVASGARAVDVVVERASFELAAGQPLAALEVLQAAPAAVRAQPGAVTRLDAALVTAQHAAALAHLADGQPLRAIALLDQALRGARGEQAVAIRCDLALAAVATGDRERASRRLAEVAKLRCPFPPPADTQAVPVLTAFVDGLSPRRAARATDRLVKLEATASGATRQLAATAVRVVAMTAAEQAYRDGKLPAAKKLLGLARKAGARAGADELAYDLAVVDLADGRLAEARAALTRLTARVPEAYVALGVLADREGDGARALAEWRAAKKAGARFAALDEWIAAKERIFGGGEASAPAGAEATP